MNVIINILFLLIFPFIFAGMINKTKALWAGRQGPVLLQPLYDFIKLLKKGAVISTTTSFVFQLAPSVVFASVIVAALLAPGASGTSVLSFDADFAVFAYILAAGKFFSIAGAMDTGSSFEGMGASREAAFSALVEPAFFIIIASLALFGNSYNFEKILSFAHAHELSYIIMVLCFIALFIMLLTEGCRVPVDDPNTHLELTMIHEVMVLDNSGPDFALILYSSWMKLVVITSIIAVIILPKMDIAYYIAAFTGIQLAVAVLIGTIESVMARLRMTHVPQFIFFMSAISLILLSVIVLYISGGLR